MREEYAWDYYERVWDKVKDLEVRSMKLFVLDVLMAYEFERGESK